MLRVTALLIVAGLCSGCAEMSLFTLASRAKFREASRNNPAVEAMCLWEPAEGRGLDDMPTRGFAGQVLFFTAQGAEPVTVEGDVQVYVFDDAGTESEQARPIHQFNFSAEAWNAFVRETNVGPSYQVFIPYTRKGMDEADCSLRILMTPTDGGPPVYSRMASVALTGRKRAEEAAPAAIAGGAQPAGGSPVTAAASLTGWVDTPETAQSSAITFSPSEIGRFKASLSQLQNAAAQSVGAADMSEDISPAVLQLDSLALPIDEAEGTETAAAMESDARSYSLRR